MNEQLEKAKALGFGTIEACNDHAKWLALHGTPEYHAWLEKWMPSN